MTGREEPTKVGVALGGFDQQNCAMRLMPKFGAENRPESSLTGHVHKADGAIHAIGIGEGKRIGALCPGCCTERLH